MPQAVDLVLVGIHTAHRIAKIGQTGPGNQADMARTYHHYFYHGSARLDVALVGVMDLPAPGLAGTLQQQRLSYQSGDMNTLMELYNQCLIMRQPVIKLHI
jgi:hypothetical protein